MSEEPETVITPYENGPYLVRGPFRIVGQDGTEIEARREVVALCRCGKSRIRPFCDGTHKLIGFRAEGASERTQAAPPDRLNRVGGDQDPPAGVADPAPGAAGEGEPTRNGALGEPDRG